MGTNVCNRHETLINDNFHWEIKKKHKTLCLLSHVFLPAEAIENITELSE